MLDKKLEEADKLLGELYEKIEKGSLSISE